MIAKAVARVLKVMNAINDTRPVTLSSFGTGLNAAVIGAGGGIGGAFVEALATCPAVSRIFALSRAGAAPAHDRVVPLSVDLEDEASIAAAADAAKQAAGSLNLVIVAAGLLHHGDAVKPEKTWRSLDAASMEAVYRINTVGPALAAKHFLPLLAPDRKAVFAALAARVGSIEDNQLGGWYAYRASKAALMMIVKSLSIELARKREQALCVGLHPGTVDTGLSKPFQGGVKEGKLFPPEKSVRHLLGVLDGLTPADSGNQFAWDGQRIPF